MTSSAARPDAPGSRAVRPPARGDARRVLAAEWTKLTSVPSNGWLALGTVAVAAATAYGLGLFVRPDDGRSGSWVVVSGFVLAQVGFLVLGVLVGVVGAHAPGTARTTFAAVPRRLPGARRRRCSSPPSPRRSRRALALGASYLATAGAARRRTRPRSTWPSPGTARALLGFVLVGRRGRAARARARRAAAPPGATRWSPGWCSSFVARPRARGEPGRGHRHDPRALLPSAGAPAAAGRRRARGAGRRDARAAARHVGRRER